MKIIFTGEYSIPELRQSVYEQLNIMQNRFTVRHARSAVFQFAESALPRWVFAGIVDRINSLRDPPVEGAFA